MESLQWEEHTVRFDFFSYDWAGWEDYIRYCAAA